MHHYKPRYSISDLIDLLSIGRGTLYAEIKAGKLKTYTIGKRRFVDPRDLDEYVEKCMKEATAA